MESIRSIVTEHPAVLVYFHSPVCVACGSLRPKVKQLISDDFPEMKYFEVNAAGQPGLASEVSVFSAPTILVFFDSKEYIRESKYISVSQLGEKIARYYNMIFD